MTVGSTALETRGRQVREALREIASDLIANGDIANGARLTAVAAHAPDSSLARLARLLR